MRITAALLLAFGAPETLATYKAIDQKIRKALREHLASCLRAERARNPKVGGIRNVWLTLRSDGTLELGVATNLGQTRVTQPTEAWDSCFKDAIAAIRLEPPPEQRPVHLCYPITLRRKGVPGGLLKKKRTHACERSFKVSDRKLDWRRLYKEKLAEALWKKTHEIMDCVGRQGPNRITTRWSIARSGLVPHAEVTDASLSKEARRCVHRKLIRARFPKPKETFIVQHIFERQASAFRLD